MIQKHSRTFFQKFACDLRFAAYQIFCSKGPCGTTVGPSKCQKICFLVFFGFDIWSLKLFALKNRLSIVPSLQNIKNIQFLTILMSKKKSHFRKNVEYQFWLVLKYVKKYAEFESAVHFAWNLQKWWVFDNCNFWYFLKNCTFFYILGVGGMRL